MNVSLQDFMAVVAQVTIIFRILRHGVNECTISESTETRIGLPEDGGRESEGKGKGNVHPRKGHEHPGWNLTYVLDGMGGQCHAPVAIRAGMTRYPYIGD
jgi:hypothetical protein